MEKLHRWWSIKFFFANKWRIEDLVQNWEFGESSSTLNSCTTSSASPNSRAAAAAVAEAPCCMQHGLEGDGKQTILANPNRKRAASDELDDSSLFSRHRLSPTAAHYQTELNASLCVTIVCWRHGFEDSDDYSAERRRRRRRRKGEWEERMTTTTPASVFNVSPWLTSNNNHSLSLLLAQMMAVAWKIGGGT